MKKFLSKSATHWATGSVAAALGASLGLSFLVGHWATVELRTQSARTLRSEVGLAARDLAGWLDERLSDVTVATGEIDGLSLRDDPARLQQWLRLRKSAIPGAVWVGITDANGKIIAAADGILQGESVAERDWFQRGSAGPVILDRHAALLLQPYVLAAPNEPLRLMDFVAPIRTPDGTFKGVLAAHIRWEAVRDEMNSVVKLLRGGENIEVMLHSAAGYTKVGDQVAQSIANPVAIELPVRGDVGSTSLGWSLAVRLPAATLEQAADRVAAQVAWLAGGVTLFAGIMIIFLLRFAARTLADSQAAFAAVEGLVPGIVFGAERRQGKLAITHFTSPSGRKVTPGSDAGGLIALIHPEDRQSMQAAIMRAEAQVDAASNSAIEIEIRARLDADARDHRTYEAALSEGEPERWLHLALKARRLQTGIVAIEGVALEITDIKRTADLEAENRHLAELRAKDADAMAQNKAELLAVMSHEIRTPLTGVLGFTELLRAADLPPDSKRHAEIVHTTGAMLLAIVNDILDLSKIEAGKISIEKLPFQPRKMASQALTLIGAAASNKGITIALDVAPDLPDWVLGDPLRLRQVLGNLLSNAVKFTPHGRIDVRLATTPAPEPKLRLEVHDTGIGIAPEAISHLFTMYSQADTTTARRYGGTGLGLALSRRLVEAMDGSIGATSEPGKGSVFWCEIPLHTTQAPATEAVPPETSARPMRILVVDDVAPNRLLLDSLLTTMGHSVTLADSGVQALAAVAQAPFDVILMDVNMPDMDGLEATRRLRALPDACARIPVIALTAGVSDDDIAQAMAAGMCAHIAKPVSLPALRAALSKIATS